MKTKLIQIGNSRGVRIPKVLIEESGLSDQVELVLEGNEIILRSAKEPRSEWDEAFEKMAQHQDDILLDKEEVEVPGEWDEEEWTW
jgi:antitoxin MazE